MKYTIVVLLIILLIVLVPSLSIIFFVLAKSVIGALILGVLLGIPVFFIVDYLKYRHLNKPSSYLEKRNIKKYGMSKNAWKKKNKQSWHGEEV